MLGSVLIRRCSDLRGKIISFALGQRKVSQWTPSNPNTNQSLLIRGVASFQAELVLNLYCKTYFWDFLKWPEYRAGHISGVQIRGSSLYMQGVLISGCPSLRFYCTGNLGASLSMGVGER